MKHLKLTVVGLFALTAAAPDAFAFGPPGPPHLRMGAAYRISRSGAACRIRRWAAVCRISRWAAADPSAISRHAAPPEIPSGMSRQAPQEIPSGMSRQAPQEISPGISRHAAPPE